MKHQNRTWAEIYLDRAAHNLSEVKRATGAEVIAVVKADAYGHGAVELARLFESLRVPYLAVACVQEGLELREHGIETPILVLGVVDEAEIPAALEANLILTIYNQTVAAQISKAAEQLQKTARVHIKVDTGMSRIGFRFDVTDEIFAAIQQPRLEAEGIFTHFADAENPDKSFTEEQFGRFEAVLNALQEKGAKFKICHCANSAAVLHYKRAWMNYVRAGIALYGWGDTENALNLLPVMEFKTHIGDLRMLCPGDTVSYGRTCTITKPRKIAILPAGYADGVKRSLSGCGSFLVSGKLAPICGRVCMDMTMLDVTDIPNVQLGDEVTIFGTGNSADAVAEIGGTISYELCCGISKRVPRIYFSKDMDISLPR